MALSKDLQEALDNASRARLLATLTHVCETNPIIEAVIRAMLVVPGKQVATGSKRKQTSEDDSVDADVVILEPENAKKARTETAKPRFLLCIQCDQEYNTTQNNREACQWHTGEREADYEADIWADHDENCHGRIDDLADEYPEGFTWDCCDKPGDNIEGCRRGWHRHSLDEHASDDDRDVLSDEEEEEDSEDYE